MATHAPSVDTPADALLDRIRFEFSAQRAMRLTLPQASRLFAIEPSVCRSLLEQLVARQELIVAPDGAFQRSDLRFTPRTRAASAPAFLRH
ncbi:MAG: hypothetical protein JNM38_07840 [Acidobacteria bacterium]|nr:hypothetical protein [Acidobacteriota bacterium]